MKSAEPIEERTDHLGFAYPSLGEMCRAWGLRKAAYLQMRASGLSKPEALEAACLPAGGLPPFACGGEECTDHLGREFPGVASMCLEWGVDCEVYRSRIRAGWPKAAALTPPKEGTAWNTERRVDPTGTRWRTQREMCEGWGVSYGAFRQRLHTGWSVAEALAGERDPSWHVGAGEEERTDHAGVVYASVTAMCREHGVGYQAYRLRLEAGWTKAEALLGRG